MTWTSLCTEGDDCGAVSDKENGHIVVVGHLAAQGDEYLYVDMSKIEQVIRNLIIQRCKSSFLLIILKFVDLTSILTYA